jgi:hypothetical protein
MSPPSLVDEKEKVIRRLQSVQGLWEVAALNDIDVTPAG